LPEIRQNRSPIQLLAQAGDKQYYYLQLVFNRALSGTPCNSPRGLKRDLRQPLS